MNEKENLRLKKLYEQKSDDELIAILSTNNKDDFREGVYTLILEEAKKRGIEKKIVYKTLQGTKKTPVIAFIERGIIFLSHILLGAIIPPAFGYLLYFIIVALDKLYLCRMSGEESWIVILSFCGIPFGAIIGAIVGLIRK